MHYPLRADDVIELLSEAFDKAVEKASPILMLANSIGSVAYALNSLAYQVANIAHNQLVQHQAINHLAHNQHVLMTRLLASSMNTALPDINKPKEIDDADKAAIERKRAETKPN